MATIVVLAKSDHSSLQMVQLSSELRRGELGLRFELYLPDLMSSVVVTSKKFSSLFSSAVSCSPVSFISFPEFRTLKVNIESH
jgi:hypothetical protein